MTKKEKWASIERADWNCDHNSDRVQNEFSQLSDEDFEELRFFAYSKKLNLYKKFLKDWLANPGINVGDDDDEVFDELLSEVVGRGRKAYKEITADKLKEMNMSDKFHKNFMYSFHKD